jgi:hypothetical protein
MGVFRAKQIADRKRQHNNVRTEPPTVLGIERASASKRVPRAPPPRVMTLRDSIAEHEKDRGLEVELAVDPSKVVVQKDYQPGLSRREKCRKGDETEAAHLYKECVTLRKDLKANLGADAEDPTPRLLDACLNARKAAFALNASGDKDGARANLTLHKTLKAVLTANGVDVPAK